MTAYGLTLFALLAVPLACANPPPTAEELARADYGSPPTDYKRTIATFLAQNLKDPPSAPVEFLNPPKNAWTNWSRELIVGYGVCVSVNARNSYGAYTGTKLYYFLIKNDRSAFERLRAEGATAHKTCGPHRD